jgi:hypothetical protein
MRGCLPLCRNVVLKKLLVIGAPSPELDVAGGAEADVSGGV